MTYIYILTGVLIGFGLCALFYFLYLRGVTRKDAVYAFKNRLHENNIKMVKEAKRKKAKIKEMSDEEIDDILFAHPI